MIIIIIIMIKGASPKARAVCDMDVLPQAAGAAGLAAMSVAMGFYSSAGDTVTPTVVLFGGVGAGLLFLGFAKKSVPRKHGDMVNKQSRFLENSGTWGEDKDEDGNKIQVYHGEKGVLGLPMEGDLEAIQMDKNGLVTSVSSKVKTTYDFIFGVTACDPASLLLSLLLVVVEVVVVVVVVV